MESGERKPTLTVDGVLVLNGKVLLIERAIPPFERQWVLPGGHVEYGETVEEALRREVSEETDLHIDNFELLGVYSELDRDPRGHTVSCAYFAALESDSGIELDREGKSFEFYSLDDLPDEMGFDHRKIILDAKDKFIT